MPKKPPKKQIEEFLDADVAVSVGRAARVNGRTVEAEVNHRLRAILGGAERLPNAMRHVG